MRGPTLGGGGPRKEGGTCVARRQQRSGACEEGAAGSVGAGTAASQARRPAAGSLCSPGEPCGPARPPGRWRGEPQEGSACRRSDGPREAGLDARAARMPTGMAFNPGPPGAALAGGDVAWEYLLRRANARSCPHPRTPIPEILPNPPPWPWALVLAAPRWVLTSLFSWLRTPRAQTW